MRWPYPWIPNWRRMMRRAPRFDLEGEEGYVYFIADSHLGDPRAPHGEFVAMLRDLPQARLVVMMGDLFRVWLGFPKFWDDAARSVIAGFQQVRDSGAKVLFVVGNREYFIPHRPGRALAMGIPFDHVAAGACTLAWGGRRYGLTHGDVINRADHRHLSFQWVARSHPFRWAFQAMPPPVARAVADALERSMKTSNQAIKIQFPLPELEAFGQTVIGDLDGFFLGHFHRDEAVPVPGKSVPLRIVPDWHSRRTVLRMAVDGAIEPLSFDGGTAGGDSEAGVHADSGKQGDEASDAGPIASGGGAGS